MAMSFQNADGDPIAPVGWQSGDDLSTDSLLGLPSAQACEEKMSPPSRPAFAECTEIRVRSPPRWHSLASAGAASAAAPLASAAVAMAPAAGQSMPSVAVALAGPVRDDSARWATPTRQRSVPGAVGMALEQLPS